VKTIEFPEQTVIIAKDQTEYLPLPVHRHPGEDGLITCCWKLSIGERLKVLFSGVIWHQIMTFRKPLQPQLLTTEKPDMEPQEPVISIVEPYHSKLKLEPERLS